LAVLNKNKPGFTAKVEAERAIQLRVLRRMGSIVEQASNVSCCFADLVSPVTNDNLRN